MNTQHSQWYKSKVSCSCRAANLQSLAPSQINHTWSSSIWWDSHWCIDVWNHSRHYQIQLFNLMMHWNNECTTDVHITFLSVKPIKCNFTISDTARETSRQVCWGTLELNSAHHSPPAVGLDTRVHRLNSNNYL